MILKLIVNLIVFLIFIGILYTMQKKYIQFNKRVLTGLGLGLIFGLGLHFCYPFTDNINPIISQTNNWTKIIGDGYIKLLKMIVMPLIIVSIISAIISVRGNSSIQKISFLTIGTLIFTTAIAATIGALIANFFNLSSLNMEIGGDEAAKGIDLINKNEKLQNKTVADFILSFIPDNPFFSMTGQGASPTIAVVVFSILIGIAANGIGKKKPEVFQTFETLIKMANAIVMRLVTIVLRLTPYGVLALISIIVSESNFVKILDLGKFVIASYIAIILMFIVHMILILFTGVSLKQYIKKIFPLLAFAFSSRTSAGAIPLNIETQTKKLGISESIANFAASFGSTIGQNGCAGIYPAMLAVMIAPSMGIDFDLLFLVKLVTLVAISSFGVAGVGGGATFAALIVLSSMGFNVALVGLLISIEPLIDMGRTALNVSGSVLSGMITAKTMKEIDMEVFNSNTTHTDTSFSNEN